MLLRPLDAPRTADMAALRDENEMLALERAELAERMRLPPPAGPAGGNGGGGLISGIANALRGNSPANRMRRIDEKMRDNRSRERMLYGSKYDGMLSAADGFYREFASLRNDVEAFNARFSRSPKGGAFLRHLQWVSDRTGQPVEQIRERMHNPRDSAPELAELRRRAGRLHGDPEFSADQRALESRAAKLAGARHEFSESLQSLADNGVPLDHARNVPHVLDRMELPDALLAKPGGARIDRMKADFKKLMDEFREVVRKIIDSIRTVFGGGPRA